MTTEEKARAYDEALERVRALRQEAIDKGYAIDYVKDYEAIFPELAESDDERIRKKIIENVRLSGGYTDEEIDEMISWLEKQKDQKPAEWSEDLKNEFAKKHFDGYIMGREDTMRKMKDFLESHFNTQSGTSTLKAEEEK